MFRLLDLTQIQAKSWKYQLENTKIEIDFSQRYYVLRTLQIALDRYLLGFGTKI